MQKGRTYLVVSYYTFDDPLFQGLLWRIVQKSKREGDRIVLITLERSPASSDRKLELRLSGVLWHPILFVQGNAFAWKKAAMLVRAMCSVLFLTCWYRPKLVFTSGSLAASLAWPTTAIARVKQVVYAFEPHSLFVLEQKNLPESSLAYRAMVFFEKRVMLGRSKMFTGTEEGIRWVKKTAPKADVSKLPTGADEELFYFRALDRTTIREKMGVNKEAVIVYVGKFGDLYLGEELIAFFAQCKALRDDLFFLLLTPQECKESALTWLKKYNISPNSFYLDSCALHELPSYLSAGDVGVVAYANIPSRSFTSPTKSGNYLLSGLPYAVQEGTSEDGVMLTKHNCGYVIPSYELKEVPGFLDFLQRCQAEDAKELRERCRTAGMAYRSLSIALRKYDSLFGSTNE
jgi:hypothetical protein